MTQRIPLEGTKQHRLSVYEYADGRYRCLCECGKELWLAAGALLSKTRPTKSCGCYRKEVTGNMSRKHGLSKTRTHKAWLSMKARCYIPTATCYKDYGGRGITVCARWKASFENFLSDMGECPDQHGLDRIDVNGNYEPENCRWQHKRDQAKNQRRTFRVEGKTLDEWADELGLSKSVIYQRYRKHGTFTLPANWNPLTRKYQMENQNGTQR